MLQNLIITGKLNRNIWKIFELADQVLLKNARQPIFFKISTLHNIKIHNLEHQFACDITNQQMLHSTSFLVRLSKI